MDNWVFVLGLVALTQLAITFVWQIARILFGPGRPDAMIARVIAVGLGLAVGAVLIPRFLPAGAGIDVLYLRLINARHAPFQQGLNLAGLAFIAFIGTYALNQLGFAREGERSRDVLLLAVCVLSAFLLRILAETLFRHQPGEPGFLALQALPAMACSVGSLIALGWLHVGGGVVKTDADETPS